MFGYTVKGPLKLLKEKLLSSSTESSNLLQYVSDFCTKLFTACESAKANISSTQKSVEEKYDADIAERNFQPGLKVLALLPVPGNTLSSRFFVPYVIEKKLNDLSYTIVTPDKRKQTQWCHINMLKPSVERSSNLVEGLANVNVVVSEPKELSVELSSTVM